MRIVALAIALHRLGVFIYLSPGEGTLRIACCFSVKWDKDQLIQFGDELN